MSWRWVTSLAQAGVQVTALVNRSDPTAAVDPRTASLGVEVPPGCEPTFVAVEAPRWSRRLPVVVYTALDYQGWQRRSLRMARQLHRDAPFDVAHHLSWASIHHGTQLAKLGVPLVLGPVGGGTVTAPGYRDVFVSSWRYERLRSLAVELAALNPVARRLVRHSALILASNPETKALLERLGGQNIELMLDDGVDADRLRSEPVPQSESGPLRVLWASRIMERKALGMALDAVALAAQQAPVTMTVLGDGEHRFVAADRLAELTRAGTIDDRGWVDQAAIDDALEHHDVLLFNSVRDNGSALLHAASGVGMPAVVIDHQGPGAITSPAWAIRVPPSTTSDTVHDLADALVQLARDRPRRVAMGWAALEAGRHNTWPHRAARMTGLYEEILGRAWRGGPPSGDHALRSAPSALRPWANRSAR